MDSRARSQSSIGWSSRRRPGSTRRSGATRPRQIAVEDFEGCPRYIGRLFRDVRIAAAPPWLRGRLVASGVRAISNVVDVTNYVMLALGSPLHVFDHDTLGGGTIIVRRARRGEELTTLDEIARRLEPDDLVIADAERAIAFAAIMGGLDTEVRDGTTSVLLEAANFEPIGILRTSERHALRTEGSNRWEKGVDPYLAEQAAVLATQLLVETAGARYVGNADVHAGLPERPVVRLRPEQVGVVTGLEVSVGEQQEILVGIGCALSPNGEWIVPTWRSRDLRREIDLVEEVARVHGLEQIPFTLPTRTAMFGRLTREQRLRRRVEDVVSGIGFSEAYTWSLVRADPDPNALRLPVPMTADHAILRTTLLEGLVDTARRNVNAGNDGIALFEIARVYLPTRDALPDERWRLGGIAEGGFFRAKGAVEALHEALHVEASFVRAAEPFLHPGKAAHIRSGWVGELRPTLLDGTWGAFELDLETLFADVTDRILYEDVITYPAVHQDLAFVVDEDVPAGELVAAAREAAGPELHEARVFDVYRGDQVGAGRKSVAIGVVFRSSERTLSDEDAQKLRARIVAALAERFGAELRA